MKPITVNKWLLPLVAIMCLVFGAGPAAAQAVQRGQGLAAVGPLNANGYPTFYTDKQGVSVEPCLDPPTTAVPVADPCALRGTLPLGDAAPIVFVSNFPKEFFYFNATAKLVAGSVDALLVAAVEGGFTAPLPATVGQQVVFTRLRIRVNGGLVEGQTYKATHPYGELIFIAEAGGTLKQVTYDLGCLAAPCGAFDQVLTSPVTGPFLTAVAPPPGYLGNPNITQTVTGSPTGNNFFRIDLINASTHAFVETVAETNLFNVWGKLYTGPPTPPTLAIDRTSYARNASGTTVNVFARSIGATAVTATVAGSTITLTPDPSNGRYFGQAAGTAAGPGDTVLVTATNGTGSTTLSSVLADDVAIDGASYDPATHTLTITAHSSDATAAPVLTAESEETPPLPLGTLNAGTLAVAQPAPPAFVTVLSASGGNATRAVDPNPAPASPSKIVTSLNLVSSLNPSELGQPVTFTATVVFQGAGTPTGTVTFFDGGTQLGPQPVPVAANKTATFTVSNLAIASHFITAAYSGDANFTVSSSNAVSQVVNKATTTLTLGGNPNPSALGQAVTFAASVTAAPAAGIPTGAVTFFDGGTQLGAPVPVANGLASISVSTLTVGSHLITASYSGDASFKAAASNIFTETVQGGIGSTTAVTAAPNPALKRQQVTLTATVNSSTTSAAPGSVTFTSTSPNGQTTVLGNATVNASGVATLQFVAPNQARTFTITASYGGNTNLAPSSGTTSLIVQ